MGSFSTLRRSEIGSQGRSTGATVTRVKSEITFLAIIAALHLIIGGAHHYAHLVADVENSVPQLLFVLLVVTVAPWAAIYLAWKKDLKIGAVLFSVSMAASLVFGLMLHFAIESPDLYSNVVPEHRPVFLHSALGLALVEFAGLAFGSYLCFRSRRAP